MRKKMKDIKVGEYFRDDGSGIFVIVNVKGSDETLLINLSSNVALPPDLENWGEVEVISIDNPIEEPEVDWSPKTCWTCDQRIGEECGIDGREVYNDTPACDNYLNGE